MFDDVHRSRLTALVLGAAALGAGGCELIPGLFAGPPSTPDPSAVSAPLTVTVVQAEGTLGGAPIEAREILASGLRTGDSLQLTLDLPSQGATLDVSMPSADLSSENPYVGGQGDFPTDAGPLPIRLTDAGPPGPGEPPPLPPNAAVLIACPAAAECARADDFGLQVEQMADGRRVVLDGTWSRGDRVHAELVYHEQR